MDLNKDAILRRLDNIIGLYGEAREDNEIEFSIDVGMIISQLEIYDQEIQRQGLADAGAER